MARRQIDRRHYQRTGTPQRIAGFNRTLTDDEQKLPRGIRRVLAGVRRPLRLTEWAAVITREANKVLALPRTAKVGQ